MRCTDGRQLMGVVIVSAVAGLGRGQGTHATPVSVTPEIVVTASRIASDIQSAPFTVYNMSAAAETESAAPRTTPDALKGVPSVMVQKTSYGQGSPYLRGVTGFRTLCLVDGIRLNNSVFRDGPNQYWNTVDPLSIQNYELVMGPASVLYGSDAVGGVLNAIPAEAPDYSGAPVWERRLSYRGATADRSTVGRAQVGARLNANVGFVGGLTGKQFGDLEGGRDVGRQKHTGYDEQAYDARLDYYIDENSRLSFGHQTVSQDDVWRTHRTMYGINWHGLSKGDDKVHSYDQHRDLTYLRYRAEQMDGLVDGVTATISRQAQSESLHRVRKNDQRDEQGFDVETWGVALQLESDTAVGDWVYGTEYYRDAVDSYGRKYKADGGLEKIEIQGPVADNAAYDNLGLYVQDTLALLGGALDVTPGVRYSYARAAADRVTDPRTGKAISLVDDWAAVTGSLRLLHPLTQDRRHVLFAGASQAFRAPNLSDLTRFDIARSGEIETPAPGLDPEEYMEYETGLKSRTKRLVSQISLFYTRIDGMIVRTPTGRMIDGNAEVTKRNSGKGHIQGVEVSERYRFSPQWSAWGSVAILDGQVAAYPTSSTQQESDYISRLMPPTAQAGVRWQTATGKYWSELVGDAAAKADKLSADDKRDTQRIPPGGTPGYAVGTARTGVRFAQGVELALALENLFDTDYRIHGSGVNEPGRNLVLTANCTF